MNDHVGVALRSYTKPAVPTHTPTSTHMSTRTYRPHGACFAATDHDSSLATMTAMSGRVQQRARRHGGASSSLVQRFRRRHDADRLRALFGAPDTVSPCRREDMVSIMESMESVGTEAKRA